MRNTSSVIIAVSLLLSSMVTGGKKRKHVWSVVYCLYISRGKAEYLYSYM